ncbi:MAG: hemolysin family protein [Deltaproteobacteria bacterium]|nr:hemolysin family protein [Deltaproteobacteria bacterium]
MDDAQSAPLIEILGIVACLAGSFFFSGAETALTRITANRARHLIESEPGRYGLLRFWIENRRRIIAALLVGNNLVNILCSILAYRLAERYVPNYAEALSVFGMTLVILAFAEITPKSLALHYAERIAVPVLRVVWVLDKLLWIVTAPLSRIPGLFLRGGVSGPEEPPVTEDEIEFHIRLGHDHEVFEEKEQGDLLMSAVEFSETTVRQVMVPRTDIFALEESTPVGEALEAVISQGYSRIPVSRDSLDDIVGLLYSKDLLRQIEKARGDERGTITPLLRKPPFFVPETLKISTLLAAMRRRRQHMAVVVDEFGGTAGLVTMEDIIEELVGEIGDEFDVDNPMIRKAEDGRWIVDARVSVRDLEGATGIALPDSAEYESVGGFVTAECGCIPETGRVVAAAGHEFKVVEADARRVLRLSIGSTGEVAPVADRPDD